MRKSGVTRWTLIWAAVMTLMSSGRALAAQDVVLYASDVTTLNGNWSKGAQY